MTQHAGLDVERWRQFDHPQRMLMIANEMQRASRLMGADHLDRRRRAYERVLRLTDLTVALAQRRAVRRELLRWRDLPAALYVADSARPDEHRAALRGLLQLTPESAAQIPLLGC